MNKTLHNIVNMYYKFKFLILVLVYFVFLSFNFINSKILFFYILSVGKKYFGLQKYFFSLIHPKSSQSASFFLQKLCSIGTSQ